MYTTDALRERYARTSDGDLLALMHVGPERLTPESRQALVEEAMRRGLKIPAGWPVAAPVGSYAPPGPRIYIKANIGSRLLALIIDSLVGIVPLLAFGGIVFVSGVMMRRSVGLSMLGFAACVLWSFWYHFTKDGREGGQSIGKDMMDLMVVNTDTNEPCTMAESAIRAVVWLAVNLIPLVGIFIEPIMAIADENGRRLGDRAAHTQVIPVSSYVPNVR